MHLNITAVPVGIARPCSLIALFFQGWSFGFLLCERRRVGYPAAEGEIWKSPLCGRRPASRRWYVNAQTTDLSIHDCPKRIFKAKQYALKIHQLSQWISLRSGTFLALNPWWISPFVPPAGVEDAFSFTSKVMTVSLHKFSPGFFPGSSFHWRSSVCSSDSFWGGGG